MKLAIFDFDGTLLTKDTLPSLGREWIRQKRSRSRYYFVFLIIIPVFFYYKFGLVSREKFKQRAFEKFNRIFQGMSHGEINGFFLDAYPNLKKAFNNKVLKEIELAHEHGFHCVLLSGSYADLLRIAARDLGIDTVIAAELAFRNGVFDYREDITFISGAKKAALLLEKFAGENIDWAESKCYADSTADIELMQLAGKPVAVNPDPGLLAHAIISKWEIIGLNEPADHF